MVGSLPLSRTEASQFAYILFGMTIVYFFLSIALVRFMTAGLPIRAIFGILIFICVYAIRPSLLVSALMANWQLLTLIAYAAFIGAMVSLFNDATFEETMRQLLEIHFQAAICLMTGYGLLHLMGARRLVLSFLLIVLISSMVAVLQSLHIEVGWTIRDHLQKMQEYDAETIFLTQRMRAMGLSFSPVHLGTQICLAFAAVFLMYSTERQVKDFSFLVRIAIWFFVMLFFAVVSGNRSPILGFMIFLGFYAFYLRPSYAVLVGVLFMPILIMAYITFMENIDIFTGSEIRVLRVGDKSSEGREALRAFGTLLFLHQPFGYGLTFNSLEHVEPFWPQLQNYENAETVWGNAVHNFYLLFILKYGLLAFPIAGYCFYKLIGNIHAFLAFLPYAVHIFFHNDGPLQADFMIWFFLPMVSAYHKYNDVTLAEGRYEANAFNQSHRRK